MITKNYKPASFFIKEGIKKPTFFQRVRLRRIKFYQYKGLAKLYSIIDWNKKCPNEQFPLDI